MDQRLLTYDVLICGAGPAGSTCALALGESGLKVALLDKSAFPRDKICGDAIAAYVPKVLNSIHPRYKDALDAFAARSPVDVMRVVAPSGAILDLPSGESGFISARLDFDDFLFRQAAALDNVDVFLDTQVQSLEITAEKVSVQTGTGRIFEAALIIGCDGAHSVVMKHTAPARMDPGHHFAAVRAYFEGVSGIPQGTFELHFLSELLPGYFWIFPLPGGRANVGLGVLSEQVARQRLNLRKELERIITAHPGLKVRFDKAVRTSDIQGFGLPLGSRKVTISGDRFMLCGDAASLIDPASGEGIGQSMISGRYAGWQAIKCFETRDFSAACMKAYDKQVYDKLWKEHRFHYLLRKWVISKPGLFSFLIASTARSRLLQALLRRIIGAGT